MPLPNVTCPVCRTNMSLDVLLADDSVREALLAVVDVAADGDTFIKPLLRYIGLFAPAKTQMQHSRIASLINELVPDVKAAQITRNGSVYPAPRSYWSQAFEIALQAAHTGTLRTPLKSHGWLYEVIAGFARKADAAKETALENQRKGVAGYGNHRTDAVHSTTSPQPQTCQIAQVATKAVPMPAEERAKLAKLGLLKGNRHAD